MRILFMGHQTWACLTLKALLEAGHEIVGVIAEPDRFDRKYKWKDKYQSLRETALELKLPVYQPENINDAESVKLMERLDPELIVIVSYHSIIGKDLIDKYKIINAHGSLLPKYRGRAPINWAIINGEKETGVTVCYVNEKLDTGDIILQERVGIGFEEAAGDVHKKSLPLYPKLVTEAVGLIEKGEAPRIPQDHSKATYFSRRKPEDGIIEWGKTSVELYNWVRALAHPFPGAFTYHNGRKLMIWKASLLDDSYIGKPGEIVDVTGRGFVVKARKGALLVEKVQPEGDSEMDAGRFLKKFNVRRDAILCNED